MQFTSATYRLKVGVPATVEHAGSHHQNVADTTTGITNQVNAKHIAETVEVPNPLILFAFPVRLYLSDVADFSSCCCDRPSVLREDYVGAHSLISEIHYFYGCFEVEL